MTFQFTGTAPEPEINSNLIMRMTVIGNYVNLIMRIILGIRPRLERAVFDQSLFFLSLQKPVFSRMTYFWSHLA